MKTCKRCIMDTSDPDIVFDRQGFCNHCIDKFKRLDSYPFNLSREGKKLELQKLINKIKKDGIYKKYDCVVGISGGVDSSYILHIAKEFGLRPIAFHLDNCWDTQLSKENMYNLVSKLDIPVEHIDVDWEEFKDLQVSFLKSSTPDLEIPTDHALTAVMFNMASKYKTRYILAGYNTQTEYISVPRWSHGHFDWRYIRLIQKRFSTKKLISFPHINPYHLILHNVIRKEKIVKLIDYLPDYNKEQIISLLEKTYNWKKYNTKHGESLYTFFIQSYILPKKFGYDKRKMHLSDLICSGQITREEALKTIEKPLFNDEEINSMIEEVCDKLCISRTMFESYMNLPNKSYYDYPSYNTHLIYKNLRDIYKIFKKEL